ncbi:hypothetical protein EWI07_04660 [Sporolactobacillus sp. THM7-4]|nr:hypothetical protein EWI07_04660 [Sporolactobacillus sp. THM7-4]
MRMKIAAILFCLMFFVTLPDHGYAKEVNAKEQQLVQLSDLSDRIFQYADTNQLSAAKSLLQEFDQKWDRMESDFPDTDGRVVDLAALQLKLSLDSNVNKSEIRNAAVSLRLCVDALEPNGSPLWKGLQSQVLVPIDGMKKALVSKNHSTFQEELNQFLNSYDLIYPSLVIDEQPDVVRLLNQRVSAFSDQRTTAGREKDRIRQLGVIERELSAVFKNSQDSGEDRLLPLFSALGAVLLAVLSFVSWRKYLGDRNSRTNWHF